MYKNSDGPIPRRISTESIDVGGEGGEEGQGMKTRDDNVYDNDDNDENIN